MSARSCTSRFGSFNLVLNSLEFLFLGRVDVVWSSSILTMTQISDKNGRFQTETKHNSNKIYLKLLNA